MSYQPDIAGGANEELSRKSVNWWAEAATQNNVNLSGFDPLAPLAARIDWALLAGMISGTIYSRFSSKLQHSTEDQVRECLQWAARNNIYVPPELISVDEAVTGKSSRRAGLERTKRILRERQASVLLVFKASRLFRQAGKGFQFIQEEVVDENLRAVSVSQGIDTSDKKTWKLQLQIHGVMDDLLIDAIGDHVRSGQIGLFLNNWTTGAVGVGYRRKEIPGAPPTNRGLPRTMPEVDPQAAALIRKHALLHLGGMSIREGLRRWIAAGGPCDPRSTTGRMSYVAYRRLLANERLTGRWEFCRKRNQFSSKLDYVRQVEQPESEVVKIEREELRILDDDVFFSLQVWLNKKRTGPRGPRKPKSLRLWDLTTELFHCAKCSTPDNPVRFYVTGANGGGMHCRNGDGCPCRSTVRREDAVRAVCRQVAALIARDAELVAEVVSRSQELDCTGEESLRCEIALAEKKLRSLSNRINDLYELSGDGSEDDRKEVKARIRSAQVERMSTQTELNRLTSVLAGTTATLTAEDARRALGEMSGLLDQAATGDLGEDAVYKSLAVLSAVTGGRIWVHVEQRKGRNRTNVRGEFRPYLVRALCELTENACGEDHPVESVSVWLREPPRLDRIAPRVHELIDVERMSHRDAAKQLQREGHRVNSGNVWYSYHRWYEMQGLEAPKVPYNNGKKRRSP